MTPTANMIDRILHIFVFIPLFMLWILAIFVDWVMRKVHGKV